MKIWKNITSQLHIFVLWLLISAFFWGWIFTFVTDTARERKVTVYCHVPDVQDVALAVELERQMPEGLQMVKVHSFDYVMFDMESMELGDIFIIPASEIETYDEWLFPVGDEQGVKVYDAVTGKGIAMSYIRYTDEDFYLFLGSGSVHLEDGKAMEIAMTLLNLP